MRSSRRVIAIDLDGVCYDFVGRLIEHLRYTHNHILRREDIKTFNVAGLTGIRELDLDLVAQLRNPKFHATIKPYPHAYEHLLQLQHYADLVAVSNRPNILLQTSYMTCARDFPWDASSTGSVFTALHIGDRTPKWRVARANYAAWAIDDNPTIAKEYADHRVACFVMGPRAGSARPSRFIRPVADLSDVVSFFERFVKGKVSADSHVPVQVP